MPGIDHKEHTTMSSHTTAQHIIVTGASSGFGAMTVRTLADAGHTVFAGMRNTSGRNASKVAEAKEYATTHGVDLRPIEIDVAQEASVAAAVTQILDASGHIDVVVHNAGHMVLGPTEAFTPEQLAETYDVNVLSTQRVNRAVLPHLREQRSGLIVWVGSSSARGGTPPYLAPYFAAKAGEDSLAVSYAAELVRFGIETSIIVPGSFTTGTNHFVNAGSAEDNAVADAYESEYAGLMDQVSDRLAELSPADADPEEVARVIARIVDTPRGQRPFRAFIDPVDDGAEEVYAVGDRVRRDFYHRMGIGDLLSVG